MRSRVYHSLSYLSAHECTIACRIVRCEITIVIRCKFVAVTRRGVVELSAAGLGVWYLFVELLLEDIVDEDYFNVSAVRFAYSLHCRYVLEGDVHPQWMGGAAVSRYPIGYRSEV
jgi:hypothetical protein